MPYLPKPDVLYDIGDPKRQMTSDERREMVDRHEQFVEEMTKATVAGMTGEATWGGDIDSERPGSFPIQRVRREASRASETRRVLGDVEMAKGLDETPWSGSRSEVLSKEWTLQERGAA